MTSPAEPASVLLEGPWTHREVSANGVRFHVAEAGEGPLVLLLHGFPQFWWSMRHQLTGLSGRGYRAVAVDLRGYGASDRPPEGYDLITLSADVAGLVRALGEENAVVVGHDWGGLLAWTVAALHPQVTTGIVPLSMAHPLRWRAAVLGGQSASSRYIAGLTLPGGERRLLADEAAQVETLLRDWGGGEGPDPADVALYRRAMMIPGVAHCAVEYYRRVVPVLAGPRRRLFTPPVTCPVLQIHGALDPCVLAATARGSSRWVAGDYRWRELANAAHFPHEQMPGEVNTLITDWLAERFAPPA